jgi:hypothetical protein
MIDWIKTFKGIAAIMAAIFATMSLGGTSACLPRVLARAGTGSPPDRGARAVQPRHPAPEPKLGGAPNPPGMLWPEIGAAFVS